MTRPIRPRIAPFRAPSDAKSLAFLKQRSKRPNAPPCPFREAAGTSPFGILAPPRSCPNPSCPDYRVRCEPLAPAPVAESVVVAGPLGQTSYSTCVDIYVAAGENEGWVDEVGGVGDGITSCDGNDCSNCAIYRVRWSLDDNAVIEVERVVFEPGGTTVGVTEPAISPDGKRLAYVLGEGGTADALLGIHDLESGEDRVLDGVTQVDAPNWYDDDNLLVTWNDRPYIVMTAGESSAAATLYFWSEFTDADDKVQHAQVCDTPHAFGQPSTHANPVAEEDAGVSFIVGTTIEDNARPTVINIDPIEIPEDPPEGADPDAFRGDPFDLTIFGGTAPFILPGCGYPAWDPDGEKILCTLQDAPDLAYARTLLHTPPSGDAYEVDYQMLYAFERDATRTWKTTYTGTGPSVSSPGMEGMLFEPMPPGQMAWKFRFLRTREEKPSDGGVPFTVVVDSPLYPYVQEPWKSLAGDDSEIYCDLFVYEGAEWCGTSDYVVVTLVGKTRQPDWVSKERDILMSRVFVIRLRPLEYWDITAAIEDAFGPARGSMRARHAACSRVLVGGNAEDLILP